jgi:hypothetical protein
VILVKVLSPTVLTIEVNGSFTSKCGVVSVLVITNDAGAVGTLVIIASDFGRDAQPLASTD